MLYQHKQKAESESELSKLGMNQIKTEMTVHLCICIAGRKVGL